MAKLSDRKGDANGPTVNDFKNLLNAQALHDSTNANSRDN